MMRTIATVVLLTAIATLSLNATAAQKMYKWIDENGNVSYHDVPPPAGSGYRVEEKSIGSKRDRGAEDADEVAQKSPVVLYTLPKCAPCDAARGHLQMRKIPFAEKSVDKDLKVQDELKKAAGVLSVPTILVGSRVMTTYNPGWLDSELDQAGYKKLEGEKPAEKPADERTDKAPTQ